MSIDAEQTLHVVGTSQYQDNLLALADNLTSDSYVSVDVDMVLVAEVDNPHSKTAVSVWSHRRQVGTLSSADEGRLHRRIKRVGPISTMGSIRGKRKHTLGVWLANVQEVTPEPDRWYRGPEPAMQRR